jgi:hypothetical protein
MQPSGICAARAAAGGQGSAGRQAAPAGAALTQIHLAVSTPNATGSDCRPSARSPSIDLKSLTMAMPRPASE